MKKCFAFLCMIAMIFTLVACGENGPKSAVNKLCQSMQKFDLTAVGEASMTDEDLKEQLESSDDMTRAMYSYFEDSAQRMTYEITDCQVDGDNATVTVACHYVDCSDLFLQTLSDLITDMFSNQSEQQEEDAYTENFVRILNEKAQSADPVMMDNEVVFSCKKGEDNNWKIENLPDDALNVLTCNMQTAVDKLNEIMSSAK